MPLYKKSKITNVFFFCRMTNLPRPRQYMLIRWILRIVNAEEVKQLKHAFTITSQSRLHQLKGDASERCFASKLV